MSDRLPILVVEPDPDVREQLTALLEEAGYAAEAVDDGEEMRRAFDWEDFRCAIIDAHQPGGNAQGMALARYAALRGCKVIVIPDHPEEEESLRAAGYLVANVPLRVADIVPLIEEATRRIES
jgi:DNA-binding response OmpR family regulator